MKTLLLISIYSILINLSYQVTNVIFYLKPHEKNCIHEYFTDRTLVIYELLYNVTSANISIKDPNEKVIAEKERVDSFKEAFTTYEGGYYEMCIKNKDRKNYAEVHFNLRSGVAAKDYSNVAKSKDLKPLEVDVSHSINYFV